MAACGLAGGMDFPTSVAPFILRGVTLAGVESVMCPQGPRGEAWRRLAAEVEPALLARIAGRQIGLAGAIEIAPQVLAGQVRGRVVVDVDY